MTWVFFTYQSWYFDFNPHSHAGSDLSKSNSGGGIGSFQSTLPRREWRCCVYPNFCQLWFQSTLPRREWHDLEVLENSEYLFQSTLPRREWQCIHDKFIKLCMISIHTPTQGVTIYLSDMERCGWYFNPHSHAGSDTAMLASERTSGQFQSTLPRREWHTLKEAAQSGWAISIHTPTQGVTICTAVDLDWARNFNPHSHAGSDSAIQMYSWRNIKFQSTLPRREWRSKSRGMMQTTLFQSTLPRREWLHLSPCRWLLLMISIHTPTQGVTAFDYLQYAISDGFQSTLPRREWPLPCRKRLESSSISIHTPTQGVTVQFSNDESIYEISIHTPTQGVT